MFKHVDVPTGTLSPGCATQERKRQRERNSRDRRLSYRRRRSAVTYRDEDLPLCGHPDGPPAVRGPSPAYFLLFGVAGTRRGRQLLGRESCAAPGQGAVGGSGALGALLG